MRISDWSSDVCSSDLAGIIAYGVSVSLNVWIFSRMTANNGRLLPLRGFIAAALSQIVDTLIFITICIYGVLPISRLMLEQMNAKIVLSQGMVPLILMAVVAIGSRFDGAPVPGPAATYIGVASCGADGWMKVYN